MHFGLHLKKKGVITAEQFVAALEAQLSDLVPIGQLALEEQMLSPRDIFEILLAQSHSPSERFGELAMEMGRLTRDEVMRLLMLQSERKRPIGEILVEQGVLSASQRTAELAAYRQALLNPERTTKKRVVPTPLGQIVERATTAEEPVRSLAT